MTTRYTRIPLPHVSEWAGHTVLLILREPRAWEFWDGAPDIFPDTQCFDSLSNIGRENVKTQQWIWADGLIARLAVCEHLVSFLDHCEPCERYEPVRLKLGMDRTHVFIRMLQAWGWLELPSGEVEGIPGANGRSLLWAISKRIRVRPSVLRDDYMSDLMFDYRIGFEKEYREMKARQSEGPPQKVMSMNDPDLPDYIEAKDVPNG